MEHESTFSTAEVVGIAAAAAAALGGVVVALGRSHSSPARHRPTDWLMANPVKAASSGAERARDAAAGAASTLSDAYPSARQSVTSLIARAMETTRPVAERVTAEASTLAEQARETGAAVIERVQETMAPAAAEKLSHLADYASHTKDRAQPAATGLVATGAARADAALAKTSHATRDLLATIFWLVAAFAVVYGVLLSPERREQLKTFAATACEQAQLLAQDFRGYEDDDL